MDKENLINRVESYLSRNNNPETTRLINDLCTMLMDTVAENEILRHENSVLSHQLDMAEQYILH